MNNMEEQFYADVSDKATEKLAASADALFKSLTDSMSGIEPFLDSGYADFKTMSGSDAAKLLDALGPAEKNKLKNSFWLGIGDYGLGHNPRNLPTRVLNDAMYESAAENYVRSHPFRMKDALRHRSMDIESKAIHYLDELNKSTGYALPKDYKLGLFDKLKRMLGIGPKSMPDVAGFIENNIGEQALKDMDAKKLLSSIRTSYAPKITSATRNIGNKLHEVVEVLKGLK
jgi:hypothetical protein